MTARPQRPIDHHGIGSETVQGELFQHFLEEDRLVQHVCLRADLDRSHQIPPLLKAVVGQRIELVVLERPVLGFEPRPVPDFQVVLLSQHRHFAVDGGRFT